MSIRLTIFRFLCVLAVCGLIAAPVARPAIAITGMPKAALSLIDSSDAVATDDMAEMPCCPKTSPPGCKDCLLMALCHVSSVIVSLTNATSLIVFLSSTQLLPLINESVLPGQGQGPPRRPPKA